MSEDKKKKEDTQKKPEPSYIDAMVAFYQNQHKRAIWEARVRRHRRG